MFLLIGTSSTECGWWQRKTLHHYFMIGVWRWLTPVSVLKLVCHPLRYRWESPCISWIHPSLKSESLQMLFAIPRIPSLSSLLDSVTCSVILISQGCVWQVIQCLLLHRSAHLKDLCFYIVFAIEYTCFSPRDEPLGPMWFLPPGRGLRSLHCASLPAASDVTLRIWWLVGMLSTPLQYILTRRQDNKQDNKYLRESRGFVAHSYTWSMWIQHLAGQRYRGLPSLVINKLVALHGLWLNPFLGSVGR